MATKSNLLNKIYSKFGSYKREGSNEIKVHCPKCDDHRYKCSINIKHGAVHCWVCDYSSHVYKLFKDKNLLLKKGSIEEHYFPKAKGLPELIPLTKYAPKRLIDYATSRMSWEQISKHRISYTIGSKRYQDRIIFPITYKKDIVYFQARSIYKENKVKYLNPCPGGETKHFGCRENCKGESSYKKSKLVWNLDFVKNNKKIIICEGILSAMSIPNNQGVSILGKSISDTQAKIISELSFCHTIIMLDPETDSYMLKTARKLLEHGSENVKIAFLKEGDPNDLSQSEIEEYIETAMEVDFDKILQLEVMMELEKWN